MLFSEILLKREGNNVCTADSGMATMYESGDFPGFVVPP